MYEWVALGDMSQSENNNNVLVVNLSAKVNDVYIFGFKYGFSLNSFNDCT